MPLQNSYSGCSESKITQSCPLYYSHLAVEPDGTSLDNGQCRELNVHVSMEINAYFTKGLKY